MLSDALIQKYDRAVPRYTSYPTAPHFSPAVDASTVAGWLRQTAEHADSLSLYVHVPFCRQLCHYCGCLTRVTHKDGPIHTYMTLLHRELDLVLAAMGPRRPRVRHLHFGGGTPSLVAGRDLLVLMDRLQDAFPVAADAEIAMEIDPRTLGRDQAQILALAGINRVSLGVQDLDPGVQAAMGRIQSAGVVERAIDHLRAAGIQRINLDLMVGLPLQTPDTVANTARHVLTWQPDRLAVFGYAHVPWMRKHQQLLEKHPLPDGPARQRLARTLARAVGDGGFLPIGMDHYARPDDPMALAQRQGRLARNFQGYTDDAAQALVGLGVSSISSHLAGYAQNTTEEKEWRKALMAGRLPIVRGIGLTAQDRLQREVIERLLCDLSVDLEAVARRHGTSGAAVLASATGLDSLQADGLVQVEGHRVTIPDAARPLMRVVAAAFDTRLAESTARHSRAV